MDSEARYHKQVPLKVPKNHKKKEKSRSNGRITVETWETWNYCVLLKKDFHNPVTYLQKPQPMQGGSYLFPVLLFTGYREARLRLPFNKLAVNGVKFFDYTAAAIFINTLFNNITNLNYVKSCFNREDCRTGQSEQN